MRFLLPACFISTVSVAFFACDFPVKVPQECIIDNTEYCSSDAECGSNGRCDTALSTSRCVMFNCLPEDALCSSDDMCADGAHCFESHCNSTCTNCGTPDASPDTTADVKKDTSACRADGLACSASTSCCSSCDTTTGTCGGCYGKGGGCSVDYDCCSGLCETGTYSCL